MEKITWTRDQWKKRYMQEAAPHPQRFLVVEDDQELCTVLSGVIHSINRDAEVDWATSAEQARALVAARTAEGGKGYDLALVDVFLEGEVSGIDFWRDLQEKLPEVPIVMTSSMPMHKFFTAIGVDSVAPPFLEKPFKPEECRRVIREILSDDVFTG
jgi:DNA-binding response OmpR family regulator